MTTPNAFWGQIRMSRPKISAIAPTTPRATRTVLVRDFSPVPVDMTEPFLSVT